MSDFTELTVEETVRACAPERDTLMAAEPTGTYFARRWKGEPGDGRVGVAWHTQGSGKSLTMALLPVAQELVLSQDEIAFYDAMEVKDSAVKVLGAETLKIIARKLVQTVRGNVTIDWTVTNLSGPDCASW